MKFGTLFAYWTSEWKGDYFYFAKKIKNLGFDILEISAGQLLTMADKEIDELRVLVKDLNISITSNIGPSKDKDVASKDPEVRKSGVEFLSNIMKKMDRLDSRALVGVIHTYWPSDFSDLDKKGIWERGVISIKELSKVAGSLGIDYCIEVVNRFESNVLNTCDEAIQFCKDVDDKSCKILLDTFHMNIEEDNISDAIRKAGTLLAHLHVGEGNRKLPGDGHLPWKEIGQALRDIGFNKGIVMEPFVKEGGQVGKDIKVWRDLSKGADVYVMDQEIKKSLAFLKDNFLR